ncbi:DNA polymerase III [Mycoplasma enhydrae]|uniref:DNA polymerase III n=1 Tax=Mycoplasma enhydrae TaxID=2499220 RepID=UPI00197BF997|nr:DNA polymerase III [Mycoplasma enhydrae]MBN4089269.1 DNA polymerase III [Mycoplasma enhydrae]MCV3733571.1 DNA polymerase III [Mycoplasma enhydrae]MCV3753453.1 DNA polymerase III [Mycoplasma enhydrae]
MVSKNFERIINNSISKNKLSQVFLLSSKEMDSFDEYILYFINKINGENITSLKDIKFGELYFIIGQNKTSLTKDSVLGAINDVSETSNLNPNKRKFLIINNVENGSLQSLNGLLKFLENPPQNTIVLMTCNYISQVLKTIKSRALIIEIYNTILSEIDSHKPYNSFFSQTNSEYNEESISLFDKLANSISESYKNPQTFLNLIVQTLDYSNKEVFLNFMNLVFNDIYRIKKGLKKMTILKNHKISQTDFDYVPIYKIIKLIENVKKNLNKSANFNLQKSYLLVELEKYYG